MHSEVSTLGGVIKNGTCSMIIRGKIRILKGPERRGRKTLLNTLVWSLLGGNNGNGESQ